MDITMNLPDTIYDDRALDNLTIQYYEEEVDITM